MVLREGAEGRGDAVKTINGDGHIHVWYKNADGWAACSCGIVAMAAITSPEDVKKARLALGLEVTP
jgi:hypothetical protein